MGNTESRDNIESRYNLFGRIVFVLDVSGSMDEHKCQTLQLSVTRIIEEIKENSVVAIVLFENSAKICQKATQITDRNVRDRLIKSVPALASGGTNIGNGILQGLKALTDENISTDGATMILVTDGEDTTETDYVNKVLPDILKAKVKINCIAIGEAADPNLERLSKETNGKTFAASGTNREMAARVIEASIQEVHTSDEIAEVVNISVLDDIVYLNEPKVMKTVIIDLDIGRNTVFNIGSQDFDKISVSIQSPKGRIYDSTSFEMFRNKVLKQYQFKQKTAEPGVWIINLFRHSNTTISAKISVKCEPLNSKAVQMRVTLKDSVGINPPIIIAELRKGTNVVIGAEVIATIVKPDDTLAQIKLNNFNNIYCNYFTDYSITGRYNVTVSANNKKSVCQLKPLSSRVSSSANSFVPQFERQKVSDSLKITDITIQRPDDNKLKELSLNPEFNISSFAPTTIRSEEPSSSTVTAVIKTRVRTPTQTNESTQIKEHIRNSVFVLKKSINSPKISGKDREEFKRAIEVIDSRSCISTTSHQQLENDLKKLEELEKQIL